MRYHFAASILAALGISVGTLLLAPAQAQHYTATLSSAATSYQLGAGDVISVQVTNFPELSAPQLTVPPDGKISVQFIEGLSVTGKTTSQVAALLAKRWTEGQYVANPSVTVTLTQQRKQIVQIYGHVAHAQTIDYKNDLHLVEALAQAGGFADDGDPAQVTVTRKNGTSQTVDLTDPETKGGTDQDLPLSADDVIYVPERHTQVAVLGEVVKPGSYDYKEQMRVMDALKDADNINPETANLWQATLLHNGKETPLNLYALLRDGKLEYNVMLAAGDRIFIPPLENKIYVDGGVLHPGYYLYKPGDRILDAINGSGGTQAGLSDLAKVSIVHMDKLHNTASERVVDVMKFYRTADLTANPEITPGDAVYVPVKGAPRDPIAVLGALLGIGTNTRVLTRP